MLTLVRHGQASYMEADYDKLSVLGEEQARKLGHYWSRHRITFDRVIHGPAKRHKRTMEIAAEVVRSAGLPWPEAEEVPDLDEFDAFTVMRIMVPRLVKENTAIAELNQKFEDAGRSSEAGWHLQKLFEGVTRLWSSNEFETPETETWAQFRHRVGSAISRLRATTARSSRVVAFTSGGPIAATMGYALNLNPVQTIEFVWLSRNASYSQFLFSGERFSVHAFNAIPHLDDLSLFTYR